MGGPPTTLGQRASALRTRTTMATRDRSSTSLLVLWGWPLPCLGVDQGFIACSSARWVHIPATVTRARRTCTPRSSLSTGLGPSRPVAAMGSTAWHHFRWSELIYQDELEMIKRRSKDYIKMIYIEMITRWSEDDLEMIKRRSEDDEEVTNRWTEQVTS